MWLSFGLILGILYLAVLVVCGLTTLRKGHVMLFIIGFFLPLFWAIGALLPPTPRAAAAGVV